MTQRMILILSNQRAMPGTETMIVHVFARDGAAIRVGSRNLVGDAPHEFVDCTLQGTPKVLVGDGKTPWEAHFMRSGVVPDDIVFQSLGGGNAGSHILIDHEDGRQWEIRVENGQKVVQAR